MRLSSLLIIVATFSVAAILALVTANLSVQLIEESSEIGVRDALDDEGMTWAEVEADGLQVTLAGIAPTEAVRFAAISTAGRVVDAARVIDDMQVEAAAAIAPPRFSAELLRNDAGLSIIGLIPAATDRTAVIDRITAIAGNTPVTDLIEVADYPAPDGWDDALGFSLAAMERLPRAKVSVEAGRVSIRAITDSAEEKTNLEAQLNRAAPPGLRVALDIAAPRPVITPFTLRLVKDEAGTRFDACSADTEAARTRIVSAAMSAGLTGPGTCTVGMGVPSPKWSVAVEQAIGALNTLGTGSVTFSDADITLIAAEGTPQADFDRVVGELENALPPVFALYAKLPETVDPNQGPPEFVATLSPEGLVQLRGRISDENLRSLVDSYAQAAFGTDSVYTATRIVDDLPANWPVRVLTGLESLAQLSNGAVTVTPDTLTVSGNTGNPKASTNIATLLASKLGEAEEFDIRVTYQEKLDPVAALPTPDECEAEIAGILSASKITFEPGSATIDASALGTMDDIAEVLRQCGDIRLEIQGHTDSQGREEMNLNLSQARAQSVLNELRARRVLTSTYSAKGYGEVDPIADNDTEEGREANRRIEFKLIRPKPSVPERETTLESLAGNSDTEAEPKDNAEGQGDDEQN
ncbi:OmpA family protein [Tateyamaria sp. ANG-S1]|uniref:OmpA family protein n=1 Tax=Tateyamaria sp. ANG-S1 TaxID=1577905 RepID=UPI00057CD434|nr:OmpA family protein [Tateyamaria sp. ANG-S1]KIC48132.1 membrane protein [Tateyamaria sp. ANG-S1]